MSKRTRQTDGPLPTGTQPGREPDDEGYLAALGATVRRVRALRGMSRKVLADASGISERYIAQLESGQGNLSVLFLRRIATATGTSVEDLIAAGSAQSPEWSLIRNLLQTASPTQIEQARALLTGSRHRSDRHRSGRDAVSQPGAKCAAGAREGQGAGG